MGNSRANTAVALTATLALVGVCLPGGGSKDSTVAERIELVRKAAETGATKLQTKSREDKLMERDHPEEATSHGYMMAYRDMGDSHD